MKKIIIVLISLLLFLFVGISVYSQEPPPLITQGQVQPRKLISEPSRGGYIEAKGNNNIPPYPMPVINKNNIPSRNATSQNNNHENSDGQAGAIKDDPITRYTFWLMFFTGLLVVCNILLWLYTKKTAEATKESANAAKAAADALPITERAHVFVAVEFKNIELFYSQKGHEGLFDFGANIKIWNYGKTPAIINKSSAIICLEKVETPMIKEKEIPTGIVLGMGNSSWHDIPATPIRIDENDRKNISMNNIIAYCCGRIEYQDVFGKEHATGFCCEYRTINSDPGGEWIISLKYTELNYYT